MALSNAFKIQELVDEWIRLVAHSSADLKACAQVCRSWAYAAQPHLFNRVSFGTNMAAALHTSPLAAHIQSLDLQADALALDTFAAICNFPFPRLAHTSIAMVNTLLLAPSATAIQQLFSLASLQHISFKCSFADPSLFLQIWERCSPSVRRLDLAATHERSCAEKDLTQESALRPIPQHANRVPLQALAITATTHGVNDWLMHDLSPFDLSALKVLSINGYPKLLGWRDKDFPASIRSIEALEFVDWPTLFIYTHPYVRTHGRPPVITLSALPHLSLLRIHLRAFILAIPILSTLFPAPSPSPSRPRPRIRKIILTLHFPLDARLQAVDARLAALPGSPVVELEMEPDIWEHARRVCFPVLDARGLLQRADPRLDWMAEFMRTL